MSTDDHRDPRTDDVENISFSATELDEIVKNAEITEENVAADDLEEYGVWVKVGPEDVGKSADDFPSAENDVPLTDIDEAEENFLTEEEESLLGKLGNADGESLDTLDSGAAAGGDDNIDLDIPDMEDLVQGEGESELDTDFEPAEVESAAAGEEPSFEDETADASDDAIETPLTDDNNTETGDLSDLGGDEAAPLAMPIPPVALAAESDGSTASLLSKMKRELLAIMEEISDVKRELSELRKSGMSSSEPKAEPTGFFEGDDDETIALTGDEFQSILSSADITEEIAETEAALAPLEINTAGDVPGTDSDDALGADLERDLDLEPPSGDDPEVETGDVGVADDAPDSLIDSEDILGTGAIDLAVADAELGAPAPEAAPAVEELSLIMDASSEELVIDEEATVPEVKELLLDEEPTSTVMEELVLDTEPAAAADPEAAPGTIALAEEITRSGDALELETDELDIGLESPPDAADVEDVGLSIDDEDQSLELIDEQPLELETTGDDDGAIALEGAVAAVPDDLKQDIKSVLAYLDQLLDALPEDKIEEFAQSEHFGVYKKLFEEFGLKD